MDKQELLALAKKYDSFYVYDGARIASNAAVLKNNFSGIDFLYSLKCNPNQKVVECILNQGFGADAASLAEVKLAARYGLGLEWIHYSAPGKTDRDIFGAMGKSTIIADSVNEVRRIHQIGKENDVVTRIGLRINPSFTFDKDGEGISSKFGIDQQHVLDRLDEWDKLCHIRIAGIHVHIQSQVLSAEAIAHYYRNVLDMAVAIQEKLGHPLEFINMGSCMGIPCKADDSELDIETLADMTAKLLEDFKLKLPYARILIESGRYVVGRAGTYVTKVIDKKLSHGKTYIVLNNTLNGFIRPSMAELVKQYSKSAEAVTNEPLYTAGALFLPEVITLKDSREIEKVTLVGNLCTQADVVAKDISLPKLEPGDLVMFANAGSYGASLSPMQFASQISPAEIFVK